MSEEYKPILMVILNIFFGGFGTILFPFISDKYFKTKYIILGIFIGLCHIIHFVNILSIIIGFKFITNFYDILAGENILKPFMNDKYKIFLNNTEEISANLPDIKDLNDFIIDPKEILAKNSRITFIKIILLTLSGFNYLNSSLIPLFNLMNQKEITFKMLTLGIVNPVGGMFISSVLYFKNDWKNLVISLIGNLIGIILMICPYFLGVGLYLTIILKSISNLFLFKIISICIGVSGTFFNLVFNILQKNLKNKLNQYEEINMFDIDCIICSEHYELKSNFGCFSIIRIICNILIPGSGIFSLLCKYGWTIGIFFTGIVIFFSGIEFLILFIGLILNKSQDHEDVVVLFIFFTSTLLLHLAGIIIIIISDYFPEKPEEYNGLAIFPLTLLNLISGGLGNLIIIDNSYNCSCKNKCGNCIAVFFKILWSIIGICLQEGIIFLIYVNGTDDFFIYFLSIFFVIYFILSFIFHCVGKNKKPSLNYYLNTSTVNIYSDGIIRYSHTHRERRHDSLTYRERRHDSLTHRERRHDSLTHRERRHDSHTHRERRHDSHTHRERRHDSHTHRERIHDSELQVRRHPSFRISNN